MKKTASKKDMMEIIINLYDYHTKLFLNALDGISDKDAQDRLGTKANHIAWIAGSMVYQRQVLAKAMGIAVNQRSEQFFKAEKGQGHKGIQDDLTYPSLKEYQEDWTTISSALKDSLADVGEEKLNGPDPFEMPGGDYTFFDTLTFCTDRESYCIGQIGLYRRLLGYDAMKWD